MAGVLRSVFDVVDYVGARSLYGEMSLETQRFSCGKPVQTLNGTADAKLFDYLVRGEKSCQR